MKLQNPNYEESSSSSDSGNNAKFIKRGKTQRSNSSKKSYRSMLSTGHFHPDESKFKQLRMDTEYDEIDINEDESVMDLQVPNTMRHLSLMSAEGMWMRNRNIPGMMTNDISYKPPSFVKRIS